MKPSEILIKTGSTALIKSGTSITVTLDDPQKFYPWHMVELWSATWDGTGNDKDYATVAMSNGNVTSSLGIVRENRVGMFAIPVKGPLTSVTVTETRFKAASATAIYCRIISGGEELRHEGRLVKSRTLVTGNATTAITLPDGTNRIQAEHEFHIIASAWAAGATATLSEVRPSGAPASVAAWTADGDYPSTGTRRGSITSLSLTTATFAADAVIYFESWHRIPLV
jgi:hypothetical protein